MGIVSDIATAITLPAITLPVIPERNAQMHEIEITENSDDVKHDVKHLTFNENESVSKMLFGEKETFSQNKNDIGHVKDFKLELNLTDEAPVAEAYRKIPKQLYDEVKNHVGTPIVFSILQPHGLCMQEGVRATVMLRLSEIE